MLKSTFIRPVTCFIRRSFGGAAFGMLLACAISTGGCEQKTAEKTSTSRGPIAFEVNGHPLHLSDYQWLIEQGHSRERAKEILIQEEILAEEATRRQYGDNHYVRDGVLRAAVQVLLSDYADETNPDREGIEKEFAAAVENGTNGERRAVSHVVFQGDGAMARAKEALNKMKEDGDHDLERFSKYPQAKVENIPPFERDGFVHGEVLDAAFVACAFSQSTAGLIKRVCQSESGAHLLVIDQVLEAESVDKKELRKNVEAYFARLAKVQGVEKSIVNLEVDGEVLINESALERAMSFEFDFGNR